MKFIADVMLGRLAKRMRLLGFDVFYDRNLSDNEIIRRSLEEGRVILTRDTALARRPLAENHLVIASEHAGTQMQQVLDAFSLDLLPQPLTRCTECNEPLEPVSRDEIKDLVPAYVHQKNDVFFRCAACRKVYWRGTHVKRMNLKKLG